MQRCGQEFVRWTEIHYVYHLWGIQSQKYQTRCQIALEDQELNDKWVSVRLRARVQFH